MTALDDRRPSFYEQLRWVHDMLRRDLGALQQLVAAAAGGAPAAGLRAGLRDLQSSGALFQLRVNCLGYCRVVHGHHRTEDLVMFPAARRTAPELVRALDRLEADHRVVARLLDRVEQQAEGLGDRSGRLALVEALEDLSTHLLDHLDREERTLRPVLESWSDHPELAPAEIRGHAR